mgnify:CR=1 FL=1
MHKYQLHIAVTAAFCLAALSSDQMYSDELEQVLPLIEISTDPLEEPVAKPVMSQAAEEVVEPVITTVEKSFSKTDNGLTSFFAEYDIPYADILSMDRAIKLVEKAGFKAGDTLTFSLQDSIVTQLSWYRDAKTIIQVTRQEDGQYEAKNVGPEPLRKTFIVDSVIETNFYAALKNDNQPDEVIYEMADILGKVVGFTSDIHKGNRFQGELVCDLYAPSNYFPEGSVENCDLSYAKASIGYGEPSVKEMFRYVIGDEIAYLNEKGEAAGNLLMKTPINGARLSSNFGSRRHPISGYTRMHKGTDFAAPTGTPIYAAGNGTVLRASRYGTFGNYVRIKHANGYETAYAHMQGFATKRGAYVRQGDIIGYVGSTGASTGPHLHFEVYLNGKAVNSQTLKMPPVVKLEGTVLEAYQGEYVVTVRSDFANALARKRWDSLQSWAARGFNALTQGPS